MEKEKASQEIESTFSDLLDALNRFESGYNNVPFEGSWTPGQVVEHTLLSAEGFAEVISAPAEPSERAPDEKINDFKPMFLNFDLKMESPEFILPPLKDYDLHQHIARITNVSKKLTDAAQHLDLSEVCSTFEVPGLGFLSRFEASYFVVYHTQRHVHQLRIILLRL